MKQTRWTRGTTGRSGMDASRSSDSDSARWPPISVPASSEKRLIFDRRYGWICDEWKEPSEEALSGGRGMFCIFPIAKGIMDMTSRTICDVASSTTNVLRNPESLSLQALLVSVGHQFQKFSASNKHSPGQLLSANGIKTLTQSASK